MEQPFGVFVGDQLQNVLENFERQQADAIAALQHAMAEQAEGARLALRRFQEILKSADKVGRNGWTISFEFTIPDILDLFETTRNEADSFMEAWYDENDTDLSRLERVIARSKELGDFGILRTQCFHAFRERHFALTVPASMAMFEGAVRQFGPKERFLATDIKRTVGDMLKQAKQSRGESDSEKRMSVGLAQLISFHAFMMRLYEQSNAATDFLRRHGVQHGIQVPSNRKVDALRMLHAIGTLCELSDEGRLLLN